MIRQAAWVHGNAVVAESPEIVRAKRIGFGTEIRYAAPFGATPVHAWCHIAVPTPVLVDGERTRLETFFLLYRTGQHAVIDNLHVYDGPYRIAAWDVVPGSNYAPRRTGDHSSAIDARNTFVLPQPREMRFGLSLSFTFAGTGGNGPLNLDPESYLRITGAGADFL